MTEPTAQDAVPEASTGEESGSGRRTPGLSEKWLAAVMVAGLVIGLLLAIALLASDGKLPNDLGDAVSALLPFAVVWVGMVLGCNQLLKTTAAVADGDAAKAQAAVYKEWLAQWNHAWPTLTTSISVGYFTAVMADQNPRILSAFIALLCGFAVALSVASNKRLNKSSEAASGEVNGNRNRAWGIGPWVILSYFIPVAIIVLAVAFPWSSLKFW